MNALPIRQPADIDRELWEAETDRDALRVALQDHRDRAIHDAAQTTGVDTRSRRQLIRDAENGRLTNGYALGHAYAEEDRLRDELQSATSRIRDLRAERRLWSERIPVGMLEIAELLGYGADAPRQWKRRNVLPPAAGSVSGTPYWWRPDVLRWALERGRTRAFVDSEPWGEGDDVMAA